MPDKLPCLRKLVEELEDKFHVKVTGYRKCKKGELILFCYQATWRCEPADGFAGKVILTAKHV